ncbi:hypothetical protein SAMN05421827_1411, partial [Pedobacter terrae]
GVRIFYNTGNGKFDNIKSGKNKLSKEATVEGM